MTTDIIEAPDYSAYHDYPKQQPSPLAIPGTLTETSLKLPDHLPFDEWQRVGDVLRRMERSVQWWIGDWIRYGEHEYGEMYSQALEQTDYAYQSLAAMKYVAQTYPPPERNPGVSWSHHRLIASLSPERRRELLQQAADNGWSKRVMERHIQENSPLEARMLPSGPETGGGVGMLSNVNVMADYEIMQHVKGWSESMQQTWYACLLELWYKRAGSQDYDLYYYQLNYQPGDYMIAKRNAEREAAKGGKA